MLIVDASAGVLFTAAALWGAYALACGFTRTGGASVRICAAFVILVWALSAGLLLLSPVHLFRAPVALVLAIAGAIAAHRVAARERDPRTQLGTDVRAARAWWSATSAPFRILLGAGAAILLIRAVHGLLAPSLAWDALTYHLYKPAVWAQSHGIVSTAGPDAAGYYAWFPPYGDGLWAWWLLVMRGDLATAPVALATFFLIPVGCYASARALGATLFRATAAALALAYTPAVMNFAAAAYVDNLEIGLFVAGVLFLIRVATRHRTEDAVLAAGAFAILAGVKTSALPVATLGIAATVTFARSSSAVIAAAAAAIPAGIPSLLAWIETGSPLYPLTLRLGNHLVLRGNTELDVLLRAEWMPAWDIANARRLFIPRMFLPWHRENAVFMNLGLGPLVIAPVLVPGTVALWRSKPTRYVLLFLVFAAGVTLAAITGEADLALRVWWWSVAGRLIGITLAAAALIAASWKSALSTALLWICALLGLAADWPHGIGAVDVHALVALLPWLLSIAGLTWIAWRLLPVARVLVVGISAIAIVAALTGVRDRFRYEFYEAAQAWNSYDVHPLDSQWMGSWPAWQRVDDDTPHTIAVTAGWDGIGHNWYRYPIMGRRLQNRLLYVPITENGAVVDYGQKTRSAPISCDAWLQRLLSSPAEFLLVLPPEPPEALWASAAPSVLVAELELDPPGTILYRIVRQRGAIPACNSRVKIS